ncbi:MAG: DASS family sodium-coupled anion symporter [Lachnospiraceae bacterium]|nr:DASS family sodium-coupled anion symporter [Lachnospiraceae bacterium]
MNEKMKKYMWLGIAVLAYIIIVAIPFGGDLSPEGKRALALMVASVIIWSTEVVPVGLASICLPMLTGVLGICGIGATLTNFVNSTIIFMISSQLIARAFVETGVGQRVALKISFIFGDAPDKVLLAFMLATCVISMFLVDIPTAIIFSGIAYNLLEQSGCKPGESTYGKAMMIAIPVAAAIGGFATPVGSGLNQLAIAQLKGATGITINFAQWSMVGVPMSLILLFAAWFIIKKMLPAEIARVEGADSVKEQTKALGSLKANEKKFIVIFLITIIFWVTNPLTGIDNNMVAAISACVMSFAGIELLKAEHVKQGVDWNGIMLVGGATAIAMTLSTTGASKWIAGLLTSALGNMGANMVILTVSIFAIFIHVIVPTGGALVALFVPIMASVALNLGMSPVILTLIIGYTVSCVFLVPLDPIPLATYGYKYWKMIDMTKVGLVISIVWIALLFVFMIVANSMGVYPMA